MTIFATDTGDTSFGGAELRRSMARLFLKKRLVSLALPAAVLACFTCIFLAFGMHRLWARAEMENARTLISDSNSYKTHVTRDNRTSEVTAAVVRERKGACPAGKGPEWVSFGETTVIDLEDGHVVRFTQWAVEYEIPGYGAVRARPSRSAGVQAELPPGPVPEWISQSRNS